MRKMMIMIAAAAISVPAYAQGADPATAPGNAVNVGAPDAGTATAPTNGLASDPAMGPTGATGATTAAPAATPDTGYPAARTNNNDSLPWGLVGLLGLAGLLGRRRRNADADTARR